MSNGIKDVALRAGVSISTVSRALNGMGYVSDKARAKIQKAVEELNYVPNTNARYLKAANSRNVALLVRGITNPFFSIMIRVIQRQISLRGYSLLVAAVDDEQDELDIAQQLIEEKRLCGLILLGGLYQHSQADMDKLDGIPCVFTTFRAGEDVDDSIYSSIVVDDTLETKKACEYLISMNHTNIAFLARDPMIPNTIGYRRMMGYKTALEENGLPFEPSRVLNCEYSSASGFDVARGLLARDKAITAIVAAADTISIGAAKAVLTFGLKIPEDISLIGFDGIEAAEYYHPSLDTISQPATAMAMTSIEMLFDMIAGEPGTHRVFPASFIKRGSSARNRREGPILEK